MALCTPPRPASARLVPFPQATRTRRVAAAVLDHLLVGLLVAAAGAPALALSLVPGVSETVGLTEVWLLLAVPAGLGLTLLQWYRTAVSGQTMGKHYLGISVMLTSGRAAGFGAGVLLRNVVTPGLLALALLLLLPLLCGGGLMLAQSSAVLSPSALPWQGHELLALLLLGWALAVLLDAAPALSSEQRTFRDVVADTMVIRVGRPRGSTGGLGLLLGGVLIVLLASAATLALHPRGVVVAQQVVSAPGAPATASEGGS